MDELLRFMASNLMFLFESGRYRIVDSRARGTSEDALVVLESESLRLRLVRDRAEMHLDLQPNPPIDDEWIGMGVARRWLIDDRPGFDHLDELAVAFLREHLEDIESRFATGAERETTFDKLLSVREERADELFGRPPAQ